MNKAPITIENAIALHQAARFEEAKQAYLIIIAHDQKNVTALHMLGVLYAEQDDLDNAQHYLEKAVAQKSDDPTLLLHLANILKAKGLYDRAAQMLLDVIRDHPDFAAAHNNLGTIYFAQAKLTDAIKAYQAAIRLQANYIDAYYNLGLALTKANKREEAINAFEALISLASQHAPGRFQLACLLMQMNNYKSALEHFSVIIAAHPFHIETLINMASCYLDLGYLEEAKSSYLRALEIAPSDLQILFNLGVINMQQGHLQETIKYYLRAVDVDPDFFDAHNNLGVAYMALRDVSAALSHFHAAARIQPQNKALQHIINIITKNKNLSASPSEYIRSLFDSYAGHYDAHLTQSLHYQVPTLFAHAVHEFARGKKQWQILDLGCGTGLCGEMFKEDARTLVGVDLSDNMLALAAQKHIYDELVNADILTFLANNKNEYDLIIAGDVLVYFGDLTQLFALVVAALKTDGLFVFNTEMSENDDYKMTASGRFVHNDSYVRRLAEQHGLTVLLHQVAGMRMQDNSPVRGHLYLLRKLAVTANL